MRVFGVLFSGRGREGPQGARQESCSGGSRGVWGSRNPCLRSWQRELRGGGCSQGAVAELMKSGGQSPWRWELGHGLESGTRAQALPIKNLTAPWETVICEQLGRFYL